MSVFHLAFRVDDLPSTRRFYGELLGCPQGREAATWIDYDFFGHQISAHVGHRDAHRADALFSTVDDRPVPLAHFGVVLPWTDWVALHERLTTAGADFILRPLVRFEGMVGEQGTFFVRDPSGNALEFKAYRRAEEVFQAAIKQP